MLTAVLICPVDRCIQTFNRSLDLKVHINEHLCCHWHCCNFCDKRYLQQIDAMAHVAACHSRVLDPSEALCEGFDARYPLLVVWSLGMGLPSLRPDGSGDAEMVARNDPVQVWDCASGSRQITFRQPQIGFAVIR